MTTFIHHRALGKNWDYTDVCGWQAVLEYFVRFQVLMAASMKIRAFWDIAPCSLVGVGGRFRGSMHLSLSKQMDKNYFKASCNFNYI
jgi:hypothetical protein